MWTIYCHTNRGTGLKYIGLTKLGLARRWTLHVRTAMKDATGYHCRYFHAAIRKYGEDAFDHEVLADGIATVEEANVAEVKWIADLGTLAPNGYNLSAGGGAKNDHPETKVRRSEARRAVWAKLSPEERALSPETRSLMSAAQIARWAAMPDAERAALGASSKARRARQLAAETPEHLSQIGRTGYEAAVAAGVMGPGTQAARMAARTAEERHEIANLGWATRRAEVAAACPPPRAQINLLRL